MADESVQDQELDFAVEFFDGTRVTRIFRARPINPQHCLDWEVFDPDGGSITGVHRAELVVLGPWQGQVMCEGKYWTWAQYAQHLYGEVLRQRELVDRLAKLGIMREHEPYRYQELSPPVVKCSLHLNFDELDLLLGKAERDTSGRARIELHEVTICDCPPGTPGHHPMASIIADGEQVADEGITERRQALADLNHVMALALQAMSDNDAGVNPDDPDWRGPAVRQFRDDLIALGVTAEELDAVGIKEDSS